MFPDNWQIDPESRVDSYSVQFSSVTQSCPTLCDPMNRRMPDIPVHHQLLESTQTYVHCVGDAILTSHPLSSPSPQFSSVQLLSRVRLFVSPWIAAQDSQASLSITNSRSSLRLMSIESVMPSSHLILCCPLLLLPPIPTSIRVFSNESTLLMRWPKYWSFSFNIVLPMNIQDYMKSFYLARNGILAPK